MADNLLSNRRTKAQSIGAGMSGSDYRTVSRRYADEFKNYGLSGRQARRAGRNMTALMADNDNDTKLGQAQQFQNNLENYMSDVNLDTVAKDPLSRRQALDKSGIRDKSLFADRYRGVKNWVRSQNGDLSRKAVRRTARNIMANYNTYFPENTESGISEAGVSAAMNNHAMGRYYSLYPTGTFPTVTPMATRTAATPEVTSTENPPITEDKIVDGHDYTSEGSFGKAFNAAFRAGLNTFTWNGKTYGTKRDPNWRERGGLNGAKVQDANSSSAHPPKNYISMPAINGVSDEVNSLVREIANNLQDEIDHDIAQNDYDIIKSAVKDPNYEKFNKGLNSNTFFNDKNDYVGPQGHVKTDPGSFIFNPTTWRFMKNSDGSGSMIPVKKRPGKTGMDSGWEYDPNVSIGKVTGTAGSARGTGQLENAIPWWKTIPKFTK